MKYSKKVTGLLMITFSLFFVFGVVNAQENEDPFEVTDTWKEKIYELAPSETTVKVDKRRKLLLFSLHTGFKHWVIPHTDVIMQTLAEKTGAFEIVTTKDPAMFERKNLRQFDAVILNNNCSVGEHRNLFYDTFKDDNDLTEEEKFEKAQQLEDNLLRFVKKGGGLITLHGGIVMQNNSMEFSKMLGGSFDYHPVQQELNVKLVDAEHPMVQAFDGKGFTHVDEPYMFKNAYRDFNFRPLLYIETDMIKKKRKEDTDKVKYISWIKPYGKGHVFYSSPSHNAQSFDNPDLLQYFLDGMQYACGDLECDDSPVGGPPQ
ncbi:ThuA domain-containing protein [Membranihabitans maritimus]|uniref:ThuA domain-containing protein n=1 Tax=Membranihabitans maritimus TaxID=2904244 RepID=UPI001F44EA02|nr:ThuA domain-containing protein [Membranihabitans maritimus]